MKQSELIVRSAQENDLDTITQFNILLAEKTERLSLDRQVVRTGVQQVLQDPQKGHYFVAELGGQVVGQIMITLEWSDWRNGWHWWIQSVYVDDRLRGRGVFSKLFHHVRDLASDEPDVIGLVLYVMEDNDQARRVYEKLGMKPSGHLLYSLDK